VKSLRKRPASANLTPGEQRTAARTAGGAVIGALSGNAALSAGPLDGRPVNRWKHGEAQSYDQSDAAGRRLP
jgi:hypothetical protein